jgi:integrase/recombinase XerD
LSRKPNAAKSYLDSLAPGGRAAQLSALRIASRAMTGNPKSNPLRISWGKVNYRKVERIRQHLLARRYAPATANRILTAVRRTLRQAWRLELMSQEAFARAADVGRIRGDSPERGRCLDAAEVEALYRSCAGGGLAGLRDGAAIALMHAAGMRREEVARISCDAINLETGAVRVVGKGHKSRTTYLGRDGLAWVVAWLEARDPDPGPLLREIRSGRIVWYRRADPLTSGAVGELLKRRAAAAGVEKLTAHDLRKTFATELLRMGDVLLVQKLLGHTSADTTGKYDRRAEMEKRLLQGRLRVPRPGGRA